MKKKTNNKQEVFETKYSEDVQVNLNGKRSVIEYIESVEERFANIETSLSHIACELKRLLSCFVY